MSMDRRDFLMLGGLASRDNEPKSSVLASRPSIRLIVTQPR